MSSVEFSALRKHVGHNIECVAYGNPHDPINVSVECRTCNAVLMDHDANGKKHAPLTRIRPVIVLPTPTTPADVRCGSCNSDTFRYDEDLPVWRQYSGLKWNADDKILSIVFDGGFDYEDGTNDPGVVCNDCGSPVDMSSLGIDWT